jgi:hypothetical protein
VGETREFVLSVDYANNFEVIKEIIPVGFSQLNNVFLAQFTGVVKRIVDHDILVETVPNIEGTNFKPYKSIKPIKIKPSDIVKFTGEIKAEPYI